MSGQKLPGEKWSETRIGIWNVRILNKVDKLENSKREMKILVYV